MLDEKKTEIAVAPITDGTVTISIAEYRGLIEAVEQHKSAAAVANAEKDKCWWEAYNAKKELEKRDVQITEMREQISELKDAGRLVCEFLDSKPQLRGEFDLFKHERDLERAAQAAESEAGNESPAE